MTMELDPILVSTIAKALLREHLKHMVWLTGGNATVTDAYVEGEVETFWAKTDSAAVARKEHWMRMATIAIETVHGFEAKVADALAILDLKRATPILDNTAVVHKQVPVEEQHRRTEAHLAHPVDTFPKST